MLTEFAFENTTKDYQKILSQEPRVIWLYGLSGSGKSTLANEVCKYFLSSGKIAICLDGDTLRKTLCQDLGFSQEDRDENIRRMAELSKFLCTKGLIVIASFITPFERQRRRIKEIINDFPLDIIHVQASLEECIQRDPKGIYQKAQNGEVENFTGLTSTFEHSDFDKSISTDKSLSESFSDLLNIIQ